MRFQQSWEDVADNNLDDSIQENVKQIVQYAIKNGINHFETARGYGSSEKQLGLIFAQLPRDQLIVQTKIGPKNSEKEFLDTFNVSLQNLQLDYVDLLSIHGINTPFLLKKSLKGGSLKAIRKLQADGRVRHVGFSTHGSTQIIIDAINSGEFDYVNLHWFFFDQHKLPAIEAAAKQDMGIFIISPNDKGGKLYAPPDKLTKLCEPLTPMGFNDLFCLANKNVHTLSMGVAKPQDFDAHLNILPKLKNAAAEIQPIIEKIDAEAIRILGREWARHWQDGLPTHLECGAPLYQILLMLNIYKAFDMLEFGKMRYNLLGSGDHWFPGEKVDKINMDAIKVCLKDYRFASKIPQLLLEAHNIFNDDNTKRLSKS
jgi:predicted aldo/keto reductase-like oxidoreductase